MGGPIVYLRFRVILLWRPGWRFWRKNRGGERFGIIIKTGYGMFNSGSRNIVLKNWNHVRKVNSIKFFSDVKKTLFKLTKHSYLSFPPPCHISFFSVQFFNPYESAPVSKMRYTAKSSFNRLYFILIFALI